MELIDDVHGIYYDCLYRGTSDTEEPLYDFIIFKKLIKGPFTHIMVKSISADSYEINPTLFPKDITFWSMVVGEKVTDKKTLTIAKLKGLV